MKDRLKDGGKPFLTFKTQILREASAQLLVPILEAYLKGEREYIPSDAPVYYNPIMSFSRDVAVLALRVYQRRVNRSLELCDPFTGCGVRGVRFGKSVQDLKLIVLNDINPLAAELAQLNVDRNDLSVRVDLRNSDANALLSIHARPKRRFDFIDMDPFGSPSPFLDSAVRATKRSGLIALTATDMAPLCGVKSSACLRKYLGKPLKTGYCHEIAVRLLIGSLVRAAAIHGLGLNVLFSHSSDHYIRAYAQVIYGSRKANRTLKKMGYILHCFNCLNRRWSEGSTSFPSAICEVCGRAMGVAGPLWLGRLFEERFCREMLSEAGVTELSEERRVLSLLRTVLKEVGGSPTYYIVDRISGKLGLPGISRNTLIQKLVESGFQATVTHFNPRGIRSDAPISVIKTAAAKLGL